MRSTLFSGDKRQRIEGDRVLEEDRPIWGNREVVQKGKSRETVGTIVQKHTSIGTIRGEFHEPDGAAGASFHPKCDHPRAIVVPSIKTWVSTKRFSLLQHTIQP